MTDSTVPTETKPKKKKRIFMWFFLAVQILFLIWIIAGIAGNSGDATDCGSLSQQACNDAADVGTGIGVFLILVFWVIVDVLLFIPWVIVKLARR